MSAEKRPDHEAAHCMGAHDFSSGHPDSICHDERMESVSAEKPREWMLIATDPRHTSAAGSAYHGPDVPSGEAVPVVERDAFEKQVREDERRRIAEALEAEAKREPRGWREWLASPTDRWTWFLHAARRLGAGDKEVMGDRVRVCKDTGWHGQTLAIPCEHCGGPVVVDQHFQRCVCFGCWFSTSFGPVHDGGEDGGDR